MGKKNGKQCAPSAAITPLGSHTPPFLGPGPTAAGTSSAAWPRSFSQENATSCNCPERNWKGGLGHLQWETHCKTKRKKEVPRVQSQKTRKNRSCPLQVSWFDVLPCFGDRDELGKFKTRARALRDKATQIAASTTGSICLPAFPAWHGHVSQALIWRASLGFTVWAELSQRLLRMVEGKSGVGLKILSPEPQRVPLVAHITVGIGLV